MSAATLPGRGQQQRDVREHREPEVPEPAPRARRHRVDRESRDRGHAAQPAGAHCAARRSRVASPEHRLGGEHLERARARSPPSVKLRRVLERAGRRAGPAGRASDSTRSIASRELVADRRRAGRTSLVDRVECGPAMRVTTAGVPQAAASVSVIPQPSRAEALASSQARRYRSMSSSSLRWPGQVDPALGPGLVDLGLELVPPVALPHDHGLELRVRRLRARRAPRSAARSA